MKSFLVWQSPSAAGECYLLIQSTPLPISLLDVIRGISKSILFDNSYLDCPSWIKVKMLSGQTEIGLLHYVGDDEAPVRWCHDTP